MPKYFLKLCYLLLQSHLAAKIHPKTMLFAVPDPLGLAQTAQPLNERKSFSATLYWVGSENTAICCSGATWAPEYFRKRSYLLLRSHLGARITTSETRLFAVLEPVVGTGIPPKTKLFAAPWPLGHRNTFENTAARCSIATWALEKPDKHCYLLFRSQLGARIREFG